MAYAGLGIAPVIVSYALPLLIKGIEGLFQQQNPVASFPQQKAQMDAWVGQVNLDPTLVTVVAQRAWASLRCAAGDVAVRDQMRVYMAQDLVQAPPVLRDGLLATITCEGCQPGPTGQECSAYALAAVRMLTTVQAIAPSTDTLYGGTLPPPPPVVSSSVAPLSRTTLLVLGAVGLVAVFAGSGKS